MDTIADVVDRLENVAIAYRAVGSPAPGVAAILDDVETLIRGYKDQGEEIQRLDNYIEALRTEKSWLEDQLYARQSSEHC